jgi:rod shape-determining protein MreD
MRWIPFVILSYLAILLQGTLAGIVSITGLSIGSVRPDLAAILAVYVAMYARQPTDAMLAGWVLGLALDLTTGSAAGALAVIGPMPLAYAVAARVIYQLREAVFRDRPLPQMFLVLIFCLLSHALWVTLQWLRVGQVGAAGLGAMYAQTVAVAAYTAVIAPAGCYGLRRIRTWMIAPLPGRGRR